MMMALSFSPAFVCACARAREDSLKNKKQGQKDRRASNALCQSDACVCLLLSCFLLGWGRAKQFLQNPKFEKKNKKALTTNFPQKTRKKKKKKKKKKKRRRREKEETHTVTKKTEIVINVR